MYAFLIPFEHILEEFFDIDTIFKPYRIIAIVLIGVYGLKLLHEKKLSLHRDFKEDVFFYSIFLYGLTVSLVQIVRVSFDMKIFYNDIFQIGLYLGVFFIMKNIFISVEQWKRILWYLVSALILNSVYLFYNFYILSNHTRETGFMDNPNYVALGLVATFSFLVMRMNDNNSLIKQLTIWAILLFSLYIFTITGSRTGLVILVIASGFLFLFMPWRQKIMTSIAASCLAIFFLFKSVDTEKLATPLIIVERMNTMEVTEDPRFILWEGALRASQDSYFLGIGIGQFKANFYTYFSEETNAIIYNQLRYNAYLSEHSDYFALLTGYGIIGLLLYLYYLFISFQKNVNAAFTSKAFYTKQFYQLNVLLLISLAIFGIASEDFHNPLFWFLLAVSTKSL